MHIVDGCTGALVYARARWFVRACMRLLPCQRRRTSTRGGSGSTCVRGGGGSRQQFYNCQTGYRAGYPARFAKFASFHNEIDRFEYLLVLSETNIDPL